MPSETATSRKLHKSKSSVDSDPPEHADLETGRHRTQSKPSKTMRRSSSMPQILDSTSAAAKSITACSHINRYLKDLSKAIDPLHHDHDRDCIHQCVMNAVEFSIGIVAAIAWEFDPRTGRLVMPHGGWYRSPIFEPLDRVALRQLEDPNDPGYVPPKPTMPGVDIAGELWAKTSVEKDMKLGVGDDAGLIAGLQEADHNAQYPNPAKKKWENQGKKSWDELKSSLRNGKSLGGRTVHEHPGGSGMVWRDLRTLQQDPDTSKSPRLSHLIQAGFGKASAVTFEVRGHKGMVIFFARASTQTSVLSSVENREYLIRSTNVIGSTLAASYARRACVATKEIILSRGCKKFKRNIVTFYRSSESRRWDKQGRLLGKSSHRPFGGGVASKFPSSHWGEMWTMGLQYFTDYLRKFLGGDMQVPPALSWKQCLLTLLGCFLGLLLLSAMNEYAKEFSNGRYELLLGPFGALMTLQYSLTAAPASQPRNAILGQATAGAVSLAITSIPGVPKWVNRALAPSFAIATMTRLGVTHPPAGAHSVIYSSGDYDWMFYCLVVIGSIISVIPALLVNNLSRKRQYPIYWIDRRNLDLLLKPGKRNAIND